MTLETLVSVYVLGGVSVVLLSLLARETLFVSVTLREAVSLGLCWPFIAARMARALYEICRRGFF